MANPAFDPEKVLGDKIINMDKQELCEFVAALCRKVVMEAGVRDRRGGIYPENISVNENGTICIGEAGKMPLQGQELQFAAPEVCNEGTLSAASDVYSVGMLMYYAFSQGKLPLEGECEDAQLKRMEGGDFPAPKEAGRRIGEIIEKAIRFKANERYQSLDELRSVLDSCIKSLYLGAMPGEGGFDRDDEPMGEVQRMMLGLDDEQEPAGQAEGEEQQDEELKVYVPAAKNEQKEVINAQQSDMLVKRFGAHGGLAAPKLDEADEDDDEYDDDDDLEPVSPLRQNVKSPAVKYNTRNIERERKIAEEVRRRRRRPLAVILVLCAVLVMVAIVMNAMLKDFQQAKHIPDNPINPVMSADPYASTMPPVAPEGQGIPVDNDPVVLTPEPTATPAPVEHSYEVVKADVSWTQAQQAAYDKGGHLVVINDAEEFNEIIREAELAGITRVWIGCHRINGIETWERDNSGYAIPWAKGEPTYVDVNDQVAEDYIMLWNNNGWACNDNRDDPCKDYPAFYSGTMGYIIEYGD